MGRSACPLWGWLGPNVACALRRSHHFLFSSGLAAWWSTLVALGSSCRPCCGGAGCPGQVGSPALVPKSVEGSEHRTDSGALVLIPAVWLLVRELGSRLKPGRKCGQPSSPSPLSGFQGCRRNGVAQKSAHFYCGVFSRREGRDACLFVAPLFSFDGVSSGLGKWTLSQGSRARLGLPAHCVAAPRPFSFLMAENAPRVV